MELELPIAWRPGIRVVRDDGIWALFPDQMGHPLGEPRSGPGQLAILIAEKGQPRPAQCLSCRSLLGLAQDREPRPGQAGVIVPLVAAREDDGVDRVPLVEPPGDGAAGMDVGVVGMRRDDQDASGHARARGSGSRAGGVPTAPPSERAQEPPAHRNTAGR